MKTGDIENWVETADYVVYKNGTTIIAVDGGTGIEVTSSTSASTVINTLIGLMTVAGGKIYIKGGNFPVTSTINIDKHIHLQGNGMANLPLVTDMKAMTLLRLADDADCTLIEVDGDGTNIYFPMIRDLTLDGNRTNNAGAIHGINFIDDISDAVVHNVFVKSINDTGIKSRNGWYMHYNNVYAEYCTGHGFDISEGWLVNCVSSENTENGLLCHAGTDLHIMNSRFKQNKQHGICIEDWTPKQISIIGNSIINNSDDDPGSYDGININGGHLTFDRNIVIANNNIGAENGTDQRYGINIEDGNGYVITGNNVLTEATGTISIAAAGADIICNDNLGYVSEAGGVTGAVADGGTFAHGLTGTPTYCTLIGTVAGDIISISGLGAANVTVAIKDEGGGAGTAQALYWRAWL